MIVGSEPRGVCLALRFGVRFIVASALKCSSACPVADFVVGRTRFEERTVEGHLLAARSTSGNSRRISFAKITEPLELPQLLSLQTDSFDWLIGNEKWQAAVERRRAEGEDVSSKSGLQEIFEEISPIEDFSETMSLSFENPVFYDPKYTVTSARRRTSPTPLRSTSPRSSPTTTPVRSRARPCSWATSRS